eukprot:gnl/Ergobibamus_cyprinoides/654.p1 GENE.gnl/Ergobibamus_cyprinoides/654~~gnl/Ergobibamus_cyprinoides/654.p1  ORF type:complete len:348 (-),score=107.32 gnl/Ergobibamus_cyprinoides/654:15-920(-)
MIDVGGVYDHEQLCYDHHQPEFTETYKVSDKFSCPLASTGLIFRHYGAAIIRSVAKTLHDAPALDDGSDALSFALSDVYRHLLLEIDAGDNGVSPADEPRYRVQSGIASRVAALNPAWNSPPEECTPEAAQVAFFKAVDLCQKEFVACVRACLGRVYPARAIVAAAYAARSEIHPSGRILLLSRNCPWAGHLSAIEQEAGVADQDGVWYVVYPVTNKPGVHYVQAVSPYAGGFDQRMPLPLAWRGLRDEELAAATHVEGAIFAHKAGFLAGTASRAGTLQLAAQALQQGLASRASAPDASA